MYARSGRTGGGGSASFNTISVTNKKKKAKNNSNQDALDKLHELRTNAISSSKERYATTINRAIKSLAECSEPITTRKQALALKFVGDHLAKIIVPADLSRQTSSVSSSSSQTKTTDTQTFTAVTANILQQRQQQTKRVLSSNINNNNSLDANIDLKPKPSAKQIAYEKAVTDAKQLDVSSYCHWKVILLVDGREHKSEHVQAKLQMSGIPCEQRHLPIGDMAWIARSISPTKQKCDDSNNEEVEIMLGTIIERKETSDLVQSLFGTRYKEQRLRLQHSGINQLIYLVEGNINSAHNCPAETLKFACMETRVQLDFNIVQTKHLDDTVRLLKRIHRRILQRSFPKSFDSSIVTHSLPSFNSPGARRRRRKKKKISLVDMVMDTKPEPPFNSTRFITYNELKTKIERDREAGTKKVGAIYQAMLKQVSSLSNKKVVAVSSAYPTFSSLLNMYNYSGLSINDGKTLVQDLSTNDGSERVCRVGPKSATELYNVCTQGGDRSLQENGLIVNDIEQMNDKGEMSVDLETISNTPKRSNASLAIAEDDRKRPAKKLAALKASKAESVFVKASTNKSVASVPFTTMPESHLGDYNETMPSHCHSSNQTITTATKTTSFLAKSISSLSGTTTESNAKASHSDPCCFDLTQDDDEDTDSNLPGTRTSVACLSLGNNKKQADNTLQNTTATSLIAATRSSSTITNTDLKRKYNNDKEQIYRKRSSNVTLELAPWEDSDDSDDGDCSDNQDEEPLFVRCQKRQRRRQQQQVLHQEQVSPAAEKTFANHNGIPLDNISNAQDAKIYTASLSQSSNTSSDGDFSVATATASFGTKGRECGKSRVMFSTRISSKKKKAAVMSQTHSKSQKNSTIEVIEID